MELRFAVCGDAYQLAAAENPQIHGGVGFTWEHDAHSCFRRTKASDALLGGAPSHRARLARRLGLLAAG